MNFGRIGQSTQDDADRIVSGALDAGVNLVDTADFYSGGQAEEMLGKALAGRRDDVVLATKAGLPMDQSGQRQGASRRWLTTALEDSLRRLGVDHVDLLKVHRWDPTTGDEETLSALTDLQRAGKIRYFGSSTFPAHRIVAAQWAAREHHTSGYTVEEPGYSVLQRGAERDVLPATEQYGMGVMVWSPLASGWLSGAVREGRELATHRSQFMATRFDVSLPHNRARMDAVEKLVPIAEGAGLTLIQLALGFVTAHPGRHRRPDRPPHGRAPDRPARRCRHRAARRCARRHRRRRRSRSGPRRPREERHPTRPARPVAAAPMIPTTPRLPVGIMTPQRQGTLFTVRKVLPLLNEGSSVVVTGSTNADRGAATMGAYAASKAAVRSLVRTWASALAGRGVRVDAVIPGPRRTSPPRARSCCWAGWPARTRWRRRSRSSPRRTAASCSARSSTSTAG